VGERELGGSDRGDEPLEAAEVAETKGVLRRLDAAFMQVREARGVLAAVELGGPDCAQELRDGAQRARGGAAARGLGDSGLFVIKTAVLEW
jgi:hypothetical protein